MKADLLQGNYIQADETPIGVQSEKTLGRNHNAFAFQYSRPGGPVVFDFQMSRGREGPKKFLQNYGGILQSDGFSGYEKIGSSQIIRAGCMAHARRKFSDLLKIDPKNKDGKKVLQQIAKLYEIEAKAREEKYSPQQRHQQRQAQSLPLMEELKVQLMEIRARELPAGMLAKACNYALNQWEKLIAFLDHGIVEIDQNFCENGMRPVALGRKNWLHIGSEKAGPKIAAILSVFETCKRLKINIRDYLNDVLPKLGNWMRSKVADLTADRWLPSKTCR
jgi:transposase